uniref:Uncharacterized protein n=1 Tax=Arundo donax TaxID=35708 RepID=A0A0A8Z909_ARUDO
MSPSPLHPRPKPFLPNHPRLQLPQSPDFQRRSPRPEQQQQRGCRCPCRVLHYSGRNPETYPDDQIYKLASSLSPNPNFPTLINTCLQKKNLP